MHKIIQKIENKNTEIKRKRRVCAYARVSISKDNLLNSLSNQVSYYNEYISKNNAWEFAGVYSDEGISGTSTRREQFQKMLDDCEDEKIDLIITKSISRFARNTVDLLKVIRRLKDIGVEVFFEKENISTFSKEGELVLTILASFAQEESRSISENIKWAFRKNFQKGIGNSFILYGYKWDGEKFNIVDEESRVIKFIYEKFLEGKSINFISNYLKAKGISGVNGALMPVATVKSILLQEKYTGNSLLQKTYRRDHIDNKKRKNNGELPMYWAYDTHPKIIDMETYEKVQEIFKDRKEYINENKLFRKTCFTGKIKCVKCGVNFVAGTSIKNGVKTKFFICKNKKEGKECSCEGFNLNRNKLEEVIVSEFHLNKFTEDAFNSLVERLEIYSKEKIVIITKDNEEKIINWNSLKHRDWTEERRESYLENLRVKKQDIYMNKIKCVSCGKNYYKKIGKRKNTEDVLYRKCEHKGGRCKAKSIRQEVFNDITFNILGKRNPTIEEFDRHILMIEVNYDEIKYILKENEYRVFKQEGEEWKEL